MTQMRQLNDAAGVKPLDFGANGITGSVDQNGRLIAINSYHPVHGYITLTTAAPFPEDKRYDPPTVRQYRQSLAALDGFGFIFPHHRVVKREAWLIEDAIPQIRLFFETGIRAEITTFVPKDKFGVIQICHIEGDGLHQEQPFYVEWQGDFSLQRCAYTQLTEGGPLPMPSPDTTKNYEQNPVGKLIVRNEALHSVIGVEDVFRGDQSTGLKAYPEPVTYLVDQPSKIIVAYNFESDAYDNAFLDEAADVFQLLNEQKIFWQNNWENWQPHTKKLDLAIKRGLTYGLEMCVPVGYGMCFLTDHMLLPLSWNRDAYYVAKAFLLWREDMAEIVKRHLIWMFDIAERPDGMWGRAYLANGKVKDMGFQLDQQIFPLLELADYVLKTDDQATLKRFQAKINAILQCLMARKADKGWLFPTDETPADDPIALPYHFSSHILLWHTLNQLSLLDFESSYNFESMAAQIKQSVHEHFVADHNGKAIYAYATDGAGQHHFYHDANDFPLVFAPVWGFCDVDDPTWRNTIDFAFSDANHGGFYDGHLGSVHTPAAWALGEIQELLIARFTGDTEREQRLIDQIAHAAQWDGGLPEAFDGTTGNVISRHWFAWTNAVLACVELGEFSE